MRLKGSAPVVTNGPYLETKEYLASFCMLDCESLERAQDIAADAPFADTEPVQLRPVLHDAATDL
ncbi:YciI family protein [Streptomyces sp. NPDC056452]|uniref:YciI family protein n=1 Tax=Streptomyces sp. NPDC056452 TaxID=3345821 RepID=UPI0036B12FF4